jgi:ABC-type branched-subunit amino acid transport system permease subunit
MAASKHPSFREEIPFMLGGFGAYAVLRFGVWRWPQVRALFHGDEEWFLIATVGSFLVAAWLYWRITRARFGRAMERIGTEEDDDQGPS